MSSCGDVIAKYMKGVFINQLATSCHMTQGITPHLCLSSFCITQRRDTLVSEKSVHPIILPVDQSQSVTEIYLRFKHRKQKLCLK